jgi:uncharacterized membrane protein
VGLGRTRSSRRRLAALAVLAAASAFAVGLVGLRFVLSGNVHYANLVWNLVLAWVPFVLALVVYDGARRPWGAGTLAAIGVVWLLFLPNAPYIVTDLKWLGHYESGTFWFDPPIVAGAALLGLVLGFVSLYLVQSVVAARLGQLAGWTFAWSALVASGVGVYLGRFERWNSWDVVTEPTRVLGQLGSAALDPLAHARPLALSVFFAVAWCMGYAIFYSTFRGQLRRLEEH